MGREDEPLQEIDLRRYGRLLWTRRWAFLICALLGGLLALGASKLVRPVYAATTQLLIDTRLATADPDLNAIRASESLARTYAALLTSRPVLLETIDTLQLDESPEALRARIRAVPVSGTQLIDIRVEDGLPQQAANIANTLAQVFMTQNEALQTTGYREMKSNLETQLETLAAQIAETSLALAQQPAVTTEQLSERNRLEGLLAQYNDNHTQLLRSYEEVRLAELQSTSPIVQVDEAIAPARPVRPNVWLNTVVGVTAGLLLVMAAVLVADFLDDTIRDSQELGRRLGLPVLGQVAHFAAPHEPLVTVTQPRSPVAESFRALRLNIKYASVDRPLRSLLITSPLPAEGKSTLAANLGVVMAHDQQSVILMDGDLRRPRIHDLFDHNNAQGVSTLFIAEPLEGVDDLFCPTPVEGLALLPSGPLPPNPSELLDTQKARYIVRELAGEADVLLIDAPPVVSLTDAVALAQYVDGVLLVLCTGRTTHAAARKAIERLQQVGANIVGLVLVDVDGRADRAGYDPYATLYQHYYEPSPDHGYSNGHRPGRLRQLRSK